MTLINVMQLWFNMFEISKNSFLPNYILSSPITKSILVFTAFILFLMIDCNGDHQMRKYIIKLSIVVWLQGMHRCDRLIQVAIVNRISLAIETWTHYQNNGAYIRRKKAGKVYCSFFIRTQFFLMKEGRRFFFCNSIQYSFVVKITRCFQEDELWIVACVRVSLCIREYVRTKRQSTWCMPLLFGSMFSINKEKK
jgi:hypothetical protein